MTSLITPNINKISAPILTTSPTSSRRPRPLPTPLSHEAACEAFLCKTATKIDGVHPLDAHLICLGDNHGDETQNAWRSAVINHYAKDGDIVLCESAPASKRISIKKAKDSLSFFSKKKLECYGWDDPKQYNLAFGYIQLLVKLTEKYGPISSFEELSEEDRMNLVDQQKIYETADKLRTDSMEKTTKKFLIHLKPGQKVFLIAGSDHLKDALRTFRVVKTSLIIPKTQESDPSDQRHYTYYKEAVEDVENYKCRSQKEGPSPSSIIEVS
jgi:hypothetical protein